MSSPRVSARDLEYFINFLYFFRAKPRAIHLKDESGDHSRQEM